MKKIFIMLFAALAVTACGNKKPMEVNKLLHQMGKMSPKQRGVAFAENVAVYMEAGDGASLRTLQDSTYVWASGLSNSDQEEFKASVEETYQRINEERRKK